MSAILLLGTWDPAFLTFARRCRRRQFAVHLLEVGAARSRYRGYSACLAGGAVLPVAAIGTAAGLRQVREQVDRVGACALVAMDENRLLWLAQHRAEFEPRCKLLMPPASVLEFAASKRRQIELAAQTGFAVLPTTYLHRPTDGAALAAGDSFPLVLRPDHKATPSKPFKVQLVRTPAELERFLGQWDGTGGPLIAQPYRSLPKLVVHGARRKNGEWLTLRAFLAPRLFEGVTLTITPLEFPPGLEACCRQFAEAAGIIGCFHFDLLYSAAANRAWYLEVNVRLGGTADKVLRLGYDQSDDLLQAYGLVPPAPSRPLFARKLVANKRALIKHLCWALSGRLTPLDYPPGSRLQQAARSVRDLVRASNSLFDWRDLRGSLGRRPRHGRVE